MTGYSLGWEEYPSAENQSVHSTASVDWAVFRFVVVLFSEIKLDLFVIQLGIDFRRSYIVSPAYHLPEILSHKVFLLFYI